MIIISDLDGTLANTIPVPFNGHEKEFFYNILKYEVNKNILKFYLDPIFTKRVILTARPHSYPIDFYSEEYINVAELTKKWLYKHKIPFYSINFRGTFVTQNDEEKVERLGKYVNKIYSDENIVYLEDRESIIKLVKEKYPRVIIYQAVGDKLESV